MSTGPGSTRCCLAVAFRSFPSASAGWISTSSRPAPSVLESSTSATAWHARPCRRPLPPQLVGLGGYGPLRHETIAYAMSLMSPPGWVVEVVTVLAVGAVVGGVTKPPRDTDRYRGTGWHAGTAAPHSHSPIAATSTVAWNRTASLSKRQATARWRLRRLIPHSMA